MKARNPYNEQTSLPGTAWRHLPNIPVSDDPTDDLDLLWLALSRKVHSVVYHEADPLANHGRKRWKPGTGPYYV